MNHTRATPGLQAFRDFWLRTDCRAYDHMTAQRAKYLAALDAPLVALCRGRVLELACGTGRFLVKLQAQPGVTQVSGLDLAPQMLRAARSKGPWPLVQAEAERLPLTDSCLDTVVCTFYSLRDMDRPRVYSEVARVLRPGGRFGFTLRSYYASYIDTLWQDFVRRGRWPRSLPDLDGAFAVPQDVRDFRAEASSLQRAGLCVREIKTLRFLPFLRRFLPYGYWSGVCATRFGSDVILIGER